MHADDNEGNDEYKLFTGRPNCTCACGATFPNPEQVETHVKGEHIPSKTWSCTGTVNVNGKDQPCPEYFNNADSMWKHYRKVHLNLYHYMCSLKVDGDKECLMKFKTDECATWLYHKEVKHNVGHTPYRCQYCDRPMVQICKIKPHECVCSQGETGKKEKLIDCRHCTKSFHSHQYYLNHLAVEHVEASGVTVRKHHCNTCGREYANSSALRNHKCWPKGEKQRRRPKSAIVSSTTSDQTEPTE